MQRTLFVAALLIFAFVGASSAATVTLPTSLGPTDFDTKAFPNVVVGGSFSSTALVFGIGVPIAVGPFTIPQIQPLVVGSDITQGLALGAGPTGGVPDFLVPGFGLISIVNGAGADLVVFEAGSPSEPIRLAVSLDGGLTFSANIDFVTSPAVPADAASGFATNTAFIDLADFGLAPDQKVDALRLQGIFTGIGGSGPDILAIGVLNFDDPTGNVPGGEVPEPTTFALAGLGLAAVAALRKRG